jgi:hypothetical protein
LWERERERGKRKEREVVEFFFFFFVVDRRGGSIEKKSGRERGTSFNAVLVQGFLYAFASLLDSDLDAMLLSLGRMR